MDKSYEYDQTIKETLPDGFRISREDAICENGMPPEIQEHYEGLADLSDEELDARAESGKLFVVNQ